MLCNPQIATRGLPTARARTARLGRSVGARGQLRPINNDDAPGVKLSCRRRSRGLETQFRTTTSRLARLSPLGLLADLHTETPREERLSAAPLTPVL